MDGEKSPKKSKWQCKARNDHGAGGRKELVIFELHIAYGNSAIREAPDPDVSSRGVERERRLGIMVDRWYFNHDLKAADTQSAIERIRWSQRKQRYAGRYRRPEKQNLNPAHRHFRHRIPGAFFLLSGSRRWKRSSGNSARNAYVMWNIPETAPWRWTDLLFQIMNKYKIWK